MTDEPYGAETVGRWVRDRLAAQLTATSMTATTRALLLPCLSRAGEACGRLCTLSPGLAPAGQPDDDRMTVVIATPHRALMVAVDDLFCRAPPSDVRTSAALWATLTELVDATPLQSDFAAMAVTLVCWRLGESGARRIAADMAAARRRGFYPVVVALAATDAAGTGATGAIVVTRLPPGVDLRTAVMQGHA